MTATPWPHGWRPGMLPLGHNRIGNLPATGIRDGLPVCAVQRGALSSWSFAPIDNPQPDLDDGPTKGALLDMAREKHGPAAQVSPLVSMKTGEVTGWTWYLNDVANHPAGETKGGVYESEGLALVGLLEWPAAKAVTP